MLEEFATCAPVTRFLTVPEKCRLRIGCEYSRRICNKRLFSKQLPIDALTTKVDFAVGSVGSEVAHRVAPTLATVRRPDRACRFPAHGFHEDAGFRDAEEGIKQWSLLAPVGLIQSASILGRERTGFSLKELFHLSHPYSSGFLSPPNRLRQLPSPTHSAAGCPVT